MENYDEYQFKNLIGDSEDIDWDDFEIDSEFPTEELPDIVMEY